MANIQILKKFFHLRLKFLVQEKKIKNIYFRIKDGKIYVSGRRKLSYDEMHNLIAKNEKKIIRLLSANKVTVNDDEYLLFGTIYKRDGLSDKELAKIYKDATLKIEEIYNNIQKYFPKCTLYIRKMKSRWGVCYPNDMRIGLSSYLVYVPRYLIEYVIYHEFCHLKYLNHSKGFYLELMKYVPNCLEYRKELKYYTSIIK